MKIEVTTEIDLDEVSEALMSNLTTNQLVNFVLNFGTDISDPEEFYLLLNKKLDKIVKTLK